MFGVMGIICYFCGVFFGTRHFICSISHPNCNLEKENKRAKQIPVGAALFKCRLLHKVFEVVADLDESMVGLHFSYVHKFVLVSLPPNLEVV